MHIQESRYGRTSFQGTRQLATSTVNCLSEWSLQNLGQGYFHKQHIERTETAVCAASTSSAKKMLQIPTGNNCRRADLLIMATAPTDHIAELRVVVNCLIDCTAAVVNYPFGIKGQMNGGETVKRVYMLMSTDRRKLDNDGIDPRRYCSLWWVRTMNLSIELLNVRLTGDCRLDGVLQKRFIFTGLV